MCSRFRASGVSSHLPLLNLRQSSWDCRKSKENSIFTYNKLRECLAVGEILWSTLLAKFSQSNVLIRVIKLRLYGDGGKLNNSISISKPRFNKVFVFKALLLC